MPSSAQINVLAIPDDCARTLKKGIPEAVTGARSLRSHGIGPSRVPTQCRLRRAAARREEHLVASVNEVPVIGFREQA